MSPKAPGSAPPRRRLRRLLLAGGAALALAGVALAVLFRDDIARAWLDPKQPFQTYRPPPAPDYARADAWALRPADGAAWRAEDPPADVFFIHPTTFDGGKDWLGPIGDRAARRRLEEVYLPNFAGPYQRIGRVFAPRYRQASLYAFLTNREDAQDARRFAYGDVARAFQSFLEQSAGRPFFIVGVGQGGLLGERLLDDAVARRPDLRARLVSAVLIDALVPADRHGPAAPVPACRDRLQTHCLLAWRSAEGPLEAARRLKRALVWTAEGRLENLGDRPALCVNPLLGAESPAEAPARLDLGSTNATGLEWGVRPAFLPRAVSARCETGILRVSPRVSPSLRPPGGVLGDQREPPYNLFYANEESDARGRLEALIRSPGYVAPPPPIGAVLTVRHSPIHRPS